MTRTPAARTAMQSGFAVQLSSYGRGIPDGKMRRNAAFAEALNCKKTLEALANFKRHTLIELMTKSLIIMKKLRRSSHEWEVFLHHLAAHRGQTDESNFQLEQSQITDLVCDFIFCNKTYDRSCKMKAIVEYHFLINADANSFSNYLNKVGIDATYKEVCSSFPKKGRSRREIDIARERLRTNRRPLYDRDLNHQNKKRKEENEQPFSAQGGTLQSLTESRKMETQRTLRVDSEFGFVTIEASTEQVEEILRSGEGNELVLYVRNERVSTEDGLRFILCTIR